MLVLSAVATNFVLENFYPCCSLGKMFDHGGGGEGKGLAVVPLQVFDWEDLERGNSQGADKRVTCLV
jgi:hypothetical protein